MAHTCRGTISLHGALIHAVDSCTFVISNGGTQTFHIKGNLGTFAIVVYLSTAVLLLLHAMLNEIT